MWRQDEDLSRGFNSRGAPAYKPSASYITLDAEQEESPGHRDFRRNSDNQLADTHLSNRRPVSTTAATSSYSTNPFKSLRRNQEPENVDNLLEIVQEGMNPRSNLRSSAQVARSQSEVERPRSSFLDDLLPYGDDDKKEDLYIPTLGGPRTSKGPTKMSGEMRHKIGQLFGTGSTAQIEDQLTLSRQRPFTTGAESNRGISTQQKGEAIEEISIPFSRRASKSLLKNKDQASTRPHTTPIENSRTYNADGLHIRNEDSQTNQDNISNFDLASTNQGGYEPHQRGDDDEDGNSEYVATIARGRDKSRPKPKQPETDYDPTGILAPREVSKKQPHVLKESFSGFGALKNRQDDNQSIRSQKGEYHINFPEQIDSPTRTIGVKSDLRANFPTKLNVFQPGTIYQAHPKTELSLPGLEDFLSKPQFNLLDRPMAENEISNKLFKETIEHYKNIIEELRKQFVEERAKIDESHAHAISLVKKEKEMLSEHMEFALQRERERMKDIHTQELQSRERLHKLELEQEKRLADENSESLKRQLEVQIRLGSLAEEFRHSSYKIESIYHKIDQDNSSMEQMRKRELEDRFRLIQDKEVKIVADIAILEKEKLRYDRLMADLQVKEIEIIKRGDEDREIIKKEYDRLSELQDMLREKEIEGKKESINERIKLEQLKSKLEQENVSLVEEYTRKLKDLELRSQLFETEKREFELSIQKTSDDTVKKSKEIDEMRLKAATLEADLFKKLRDHEIRERSLVQGLDDLRSRVEVFESERAAFEAERAKLVELAKNSREESEVVRKFKSEFDSEKERLKRMKNELDTYSVSLKNDKLKVEQERTELAKSQRVVEGMRFGYVKSIDVRTPVRSQISTADLSFQTGPESGSKKRGRSLTAQEFFLKEALLQSAPVQEPSTANFGGVTSVKNLKEQIDNRGFFRNEKVRSNSSQSFNLNNYMKELKTLDKACEINGEYVYREKDSLTRSKVEVGTPSRRPSLRPGTFKVESPYK